jgi:plastocyanin
MQGIDERPESRDGLSRDGLQTLGRLTPRRSLAILLGLFLVGQGAMLAYAAESHTVVQHNRAFNLREIAVKRGDTVKFSNDDEFLHQIFIAAPTLNFDSAEQPPGEAIEVKFPTAGSFDVFCHIHPKMHLHVTVQ